MRSMARIAALIASIAIVGGCRAPSTAPAGDTSSGPSRLVVTGSSTLASLVAEIARRFEARHPGVRVDVQTGGSSRGIADVRRRTADIGMVSRALVPEEADLNARTIAIDAISLIVHGSNPVVELDTGQVVDIFTGRISTWSAVGGSDLPITIVNKAEGRATLDLFLEYFAIERAAIRAHVVIGENQHGIRTVAADPHAIGYVSTGAAEAEIARGVPIRTLPLSGITPKAVNVRNGSFPLARPLNLVSRGTPTPLGEAFLAFASSDEVVDLVEAQFLVPVAE